MLAECARVLILILIDVVLIKHYTSFHPFHEQSTQFLPHFSKSRKSFTPIGSTTNITVTSPFPHQSHATITSPFPDHSRARKPSTSARNGRRTLMTSPRPLEEGFDIVDVVETNLYVPSMPFSYLLIILINAVITFLMNFVVNLRTTLLNERILMCYV